MLFFFKEKPIEIIAFIPETYYFVKEFSPIRQAKDSIPSWWKNIPVENFFWEGLHTRKNVKTCPGVIHTITNGLIMPLWSDLAIQVNKEEYRYQFADQLSKMEHHDNDQADGFYSDFLKLKIVSPWIFKTPVKLLYMNPFYHIPEPCEYIVPHGIVTPVSRHNLVASNHFIFVNNKNDETKNILIKQGTPLFHILPLTDKKIKFRMEPASSSEFSKMWSILGNKSNFTAGGVKNIARTKNSK